MGNSVKIAEYFQHAGIAEDQGDIKGMRGWLYKAAKLGSVQAWYNLGVITEGQDIEKAKGYYLKAAKKGYLNAQFNLAAALHRENDFEAAKFWFTKAALQGDKEAQFRLGGIYHQEGDHTNAKKYFYQCAIQKNEECEYNMAIYSRSERNFVEAKKWAKMASDHGYEPAQQELKKIEKLLSTPPVVIAVQDQEEEVREWLQNQYPNFDDPAVIYASELRGESQEDNDG